MRAFVTVCLVLPMLVYPFPARANPHETITALSATDAPGVGDNTAVTSSVENDTPKEIPDSSLAYTIWWDTDTDGGFSAGDTYIDSAGAPLVWDGGADVSTHVTPGVTVPARGTWTEPEPWTVANTLFPNRGTYQVTATWLDARGRAIDMRTAQFFAIPAMGWLLLTLTALASAGWLWRRRHRSAWAAPWASA